MDNSSWEEYIPVMVFESLNLPVLKSGCALMLLCCKQGKVMKG